MKKKVIWIVLAFVLVGVLAGSSALYRKLAVAPAPAATDPVLRTQAASAAPQTEPTEPAQPTNQKIAAPDFTVLDADGNEVSLSSHFGKPVVINFWATWCGPCRNELPGFDKAAKAYAGRVDFMMVNLTDGRSDTVDGVKAFVEENGYTFPVYFDTQSSAADAYGVYGIPQTVLIYADGSVMQSYVGAMPEDVLDGFLEELVQ